MTIEEYEAAFHGIDLPQEILLSPGTYITDVPYFIESHIEGLKSTKNPKQIAPLQQRLDKLLKLLEENA